MRGAFNRRHTRVGHLFQNRDKSSVVEEESSLLELVRSLHLNPFRAQVVADLRTLDRFPWTGHSALLGKVARPWQAVAALRRGREASTRDERVLGRSAFGEALRQEEQRAGQARGPRIPLPELVARVCRAARIPPEAPGEPAGGRGARPRGQCLPGRGGVRVSGASLIGRLGVGVPSIQKPAQRGRTDRTRWDALLAPEASKEGNERNNGSPMVYYSAGLGWFGTPVPGVAPTPERGCGIPRHNDARGVDEEGVGGGRTGPGPAAPEDAPGAPLRPEAAMVRPLSGRPRS